MISLNPFDTYLHRIETTLKTILPIHSTHKLHEAMCYSVLSGGKRLRPLFLYTTGRGLNGNLDLFDFPACAIELIHAFSLIHDDLPAMDNDDIRHGKPSCHKVFGEATAILAGDALQTLAFEILAHHSPGLSPACQIKLIHLLTQASGYQGMTLGQSLDITPSLKTNDSLSPPLNPLMQMYRAKTGALIKASFLFGVTIAKPDNTKLLDFFSHLGDQVGLLFQIQDDVLDIEGTLQRAGKKTQKDLARGKITYPHLVGIPKAKATIQQLSKEILQSLQNLDLQESDLSKLIQFVLARSF